jgi:DNA-binding response OmpR family regulator
MSDSTRVLIVEDDAVVALSLLNMVQEMGCQVCGLASTAPRAVALADYYRPDVVLCDVKLGKGTNGLHAAQQMRSELKLDVVLISGLGPEETGEGQDLPWVRKPFTPEHIRSAIQAVRNRREPRQPSLALTH